MIDNLIKFNISAVVATVTSVADLEFLEKSSLAELQEIADWFEFRLDNFLRENQLDALFEFLESNQGTFAALLTPRHSSEGGVAPEFDDPQFRCGVIIRFLHLADAIDIEIAHFNEVAEQVEFTCPVVGSNHDFEKPIPVEQMNERIQFCRNNQIDVAKFAMVMNTESDLDTVKELVQETVSAGQKISAMGMGSVMGPKSRIELAKAGSCLNYGFLQQENAPGQLSARDLKKVISG